MERNELIDWVKLTALIVVFAAIVFVTFISIN